MNINLLCGDSTKVLETVETESVDLIVTSPPYADARKNTYGGVTVDKYVEWFLPVSTQLQRVLKPSGTFILNIKEKVINGERSTYVMELIMALRAQGWLWTEEYIWHKKTCAPGKWPNRFRDAWERLLQFNKQKHFAMYQEAVMVPVGDWSKIRLKKLSDKDKERRNYSKTTGSTFGSNYSNWVGRDVVYPSNVLHTAVECGNKGHSAVFPKTIPEFFIKLFTREGDMVLDPFVGSGTTVFVAIGYGRRVIGIDIKEEYVQNIKTKLGE